MKGPSNSKMGGERMDDLKIVELYFKRDEKAIEETDRKFGRMCYQVAYNVLGDREDASECVNDTYLSVWNTIPPVRPNHFSAFLYKIARNLSLKRLEYNSAVKRNMNITISFNELETVIPDNRFRPDIADEEIGRIISNFLRGEKPDIRNVFIRRYWFFDSIQDISLRYGFTESKVKNMLYHSRNKLRAYLKKEGVEL